ncbi:MAG: tRNA-dihydrouridine synthase C [Syntrophorhabdus sp. PtaB.Bin006]|nr:MAG: tRNA-dihydrouridine synthase C [Syntrophorhabdus sp. PtaB.Bin006]
MAAPPLSPCSRAQGNVYYKIEKTATAKPIRTIPLHQIQIRNLEFYPPLLLAPMAGLTHSALRQIFSGFGGVGLLSTEMLSAKSLPTENPKVSPCLIRTVLEKPLSYQLLISTDREIIPAIDALHKLHADAIDLNMGCPARSVGNLGAGFSLMEQPENARRIVVEARKRTQLPLTAKIRLGVELDEQALKAFCTMLEDEGIDMLSVHARLKKESFARRPRWEWIAKIKEWLRIPVIANGGIFTVQDAKDCLRVCGADGLMLGRGAVVKPWLFAEIARDLYDCNIVEPLVFLPVVYGNFTDLVNELFRPERRLGRLKKFTHYFGRNYKFGHQLVSSIQGSNSMEEARERAGIFFENNT